MKKAFLIRVNEEVLLRARARAKADGARSLNAWIAAVMEAAAAKKGGKR